MSYNYNVGTGMTVEKCAAFCGNGEIYFHTKVPLFSFKTLSQIPAIFGANSMTGYDLFGVEYSGEVSQTFLF